MIGYYQSQLERADRHGRPAAQPRTHLDHGQRLHPRHPRMGPACGRVAGTAARRPPCWGAPCARSQGHNYFDLEVSLDWIQPRIWRRFLLHERATFLDLHRAIQVAFDWDNAHLFAFFDDDGEVVAGVPDRFGMGSGFGDPDPDARKMPIAKQLRRQWSVQYLYDFGDSWAHSVEVKQVVTHDERFTRRLLGGERAAPLEDCGGPPGYEELVAVARGGQAPHGGDTEMLREWMGDWDPEGFDLAALGQRFDS